jgi:methylphosphotriester-DNA--protein-cysteine methyltransferase
MLEPSMVAASARCLPAGRSLDGMAFVARVHPSSHDVLSGPIMRHCGANTIQRPERESAQAFKEAIGAPPHRYQRDRRMEQAKGLPADPSLSISDGAAGLVMMARAGSRGFSKGERSITEDIAAEHDLRIDNRTAGSRIR